MDLLAIDGLSLSTILTIFGVLTVISGGVSIMLVGVVKTLRESRDDFAVRIKQLEDEREVDKAALAESKAATKFWRSAARGDEKLDHLIDLVVNLSALLTDHHSEAKTNWVAVTAGLGHVGRSLDKMTASIEDLVIRIAGAMSLQDDDPDGKKRP